MSDSPLCMEIMCSAPGQSFPERIIMHPDTLDALRYEPAAIHRLNLSEPRGDGPLKFSGVPIHTDIDYPEAGFAFQQTCPKCTSFSEDIGLNVPRAIKLVVLDGRRYACAHCHDTDWITSYESPAWVAAKPSNKTA